MAGSRDEYDVRRQRRSFSGSPDSDDGHRDRRRQARKEEYSSKSRRRDDYRSSRKDERRHRSSLSPSNRDSPRGDRDPHSREHRDRRDRREDDWEKHRYSSSESRQPRRHRGYGFSGDRDRPSRRRRSVSRSRSRSPAPRSRNSSPRSVRRLKGSLPSQSDAFTSVDVSKSQLEKEKEKEKPNFAPTGRLAAESNTVNVSGGSVVLKYHEPPEARKPPAKEPWRLYVFKGEDLLEVVELGERSCWLIGRERLVVDFPLDHPSCSKQHAALQFRFVEKRNEFGDRIGRVKLYLIDLESANGSSVNGDPIPTKRYVEVIDKDVLRFGHSTRDYVVMLPPPS